ncbi:MAG: polysaccharide export protein [Capsulimonadaceae bacterium]|nr:polysaccharide export protein [Capsulimonadaceae bacterium]
MFNNARFTILLRGIVLLACVAAAALSGARIANADDLPAAQAAYVISVDDVLSITIYNHAEMTADVIVLPDGTINYPVVGTIRAEGLTVEELSRKIASGLTTINRPRVTVFVKQSRPRKISVLGAVRATGQYDWKPGWRVLDAIAACGGAAQEPGLTQVTLVADSGTKTVPLDFNRLMKGGLADNPELQPGDVILVQQKDPSIAQVQVVGEVIKPGLYTVSSEGVTVRSMLSIVGGPTLHAAMSRAQIMHAGVTRTVDLHELGQNIGEDAGSEILYAGDVLNVPVNQAKIAVIGEVKAAGVFEIPDGQKVSVLSALAEAGGCTPDAERGQATILRKSPDGQVTQVAVDLNKVLQGSQTGDAQIQAGDVFFVPTRKKGSGGAGIFTGVGVAAALKTLFAF